MIVELQQISLSDLHVLADSRVPDELLPKAFEGALPPPFVAQRALARLDQGHAPLWCNKFYILRKADGAVVGSCGFKGAPVDGQVEIGYGVSPACQRQGVATAAVAQLLKLAFGSAEVTEVLAQVSPENVASTRVVQKLNFVAGESKRDEKGELLVRWVARREVLSGLTRFEEEASGPRDR